MRKIDFKIPLWKHQADALSLATEPEPRSFAFFMEPGTGKTPTVINTIRQIFLSHNAVTPVVIFAPISVLKNWQREIDAHSRLGKYVHVLTGSGKKRLSFVRDLTRRQKPMLLITNYETLTMMPTEKSFVNSQGKTVKYKSYAIVEALKEYQPGVLVFDESQNLKNHKANRTKQAIKLADRSPYKYLMSGSPILNTPMDIFSQYRVLDGGKTFGDNFFTFRQKYFEDKNAGMPSHRYYPDWQPKPGLSEKFHHLIYQKAFRALKKDCLDLPPLVRKRYYVELNAEQRRMYTSLSKVWVAYLNDKAFVAQIALTKALRLQQIVSGFCVDDEGQTVTFDNVPRLKAVKELLTDLTPNHKVIVWACFKQNYADLMDICEEVGVKCAMLIGGMTDKQRDLSIDNFNKDKDVRVMIANQGAGGVGVNMQAADYSIYYSKNYSLEDDLQSEARNYRGGSEVHERITRIDLVAEGTIDEVVLEALYNKQNVADAILQWKGKK